jgi:hypothetical protein
MAMNREEQQRKEQLFVSMSEHNARFDLGLTSMSLAMPFGICDHGASFDWPCRISPE